MKSVAGNLDTPFGTQMEKPKHGWLRLVVLAGLVIAAICFAYRAAVPSAVPDAPGATVAPASPSPEDSTAPLTARQQREAAYEKDLAAIRALMEQENLREDTRQQAAAQAAQMVRQHQMELGLEEALVNAGFQPCFVLLQNDALTVAVSAPEVTAAQSAVILSICLAHSDVASENIRIMPGAL